MDVSGPVQEPFDLSGSGSESRLVSQFTLNKLTSDTNLKLTPLQKSELDSVSTFH